MIANQADTTQWQKRNQLYSQAIHSVVQPTNGHKYIASALHRYGV